MESLSLSPVLSYYLALAKGDLDAVAKYSSELGVDINFSLEGCNICWFFKSFLYNSPPATDQFWTKLLSSCSCQGDITCHKLPVTVGVDVEGALPDDSEQEIQPEYEECELDVFHGGLRPGVRPVHVACGHSQIDVIKFLIDHDADVKVRIDFNEETPLQVALKSARSELIPEICSLLLGAGADLDVTAINSRGDTPLHIAALFGPVDLLRALLSQKHRFPETVQQAVLVRNFRGNTPLHCAVQARDPECIKLLIDAGVDVNAHNGRGATALLQATEIGDNETILALLDCSSCDVNVCNAGNVRPLHIATNSGNSAIVAALVKAGADLEVSDDVGITPLMYTSFNGRADITSQLLSAGADADHATTLQYSAMHHAAWEGHLNVVQVLLDAGAKYDEQTADGNTPMSLAAHGKHSEVVRYLISKDCNVNNADRDFDTPLLYAAYNGDMDSVCALIKHGADGMARNRVNATAVWNAVYSGHLEMLHYLIAVVNPPLSVASRGLDQHARSDVAPCLYDEPRTPLYVALDCMHYDVAELLLDSGVAMCDEHWYWDGDMPNVDEPRMLKRLDQTARNVPPLVVVVRDSFRRMVGARITTIVPELEIPRTLKDVLLLQQ